MVGLFSMVEEGRRAYDGKQAGLVAFGAMVGAAFVL